MEQYLELVRKILREGVDDDKERTGTGTKRIFGEQFVHDMSDGFPILTTKKIDYRKVISELEFFIKGITDKKWLQDRGNGIWNEWCNPTIVPYGHDEETKGKMANERDLGPIYGFQWRHFGAKYKGHEIDYTDEGFDQLARVVDCIKNKPSDRRMVVSAWNPNDFLQMALPPCHYTFQVTVTDGKLNLSWEQRSVDTMLGLPFNIASYATLLHLLAKEGGYEEGKLVGNLGDVHIYKNHLKGIEEQLSRTPYDLPIIETPNFTSIFDWVSVYRNEEGLIRPKDTKLVGYKSHPFIKFDIAV